MKVILLMGFALCFGMSGFGTEETMTKSADGLGSAPRPSTTDAGAGLGKRKTSMGAPLNAVEDPLPTKKAKTENSPEIGSSQGIRYSPTRITEVPTSPQRGFSVPSEEFNKFYAKHIQMRTAISEVLSPLLDSEITLKDNEICKTVKAATQNEIVDAYEIAEYLRDLLSVTEVYKPSNSGISDQEFRIKEILNFLYNCSKEEFSLETHGEE